MQNRSVICYGPLANLLINQEALETAGWTLCVAEDLETAKQQIKRQSPLVGLIRLQTGIDHFALVMELMLNHPAIEWIIITADEDSLCQGISAWLPDNLYDYFTLPIDLDRLAFTMGHAYGVATLKQKTRSAKPAAIEQEEEMVGTSPVMLALFKNIRKVAGVDSAVLITGESGTGKEQTARAVHERSCRSKGPFVAVNCGGLPEHLIQSELFGHEKGAFTGAYQRKIGRIEAANGGSIFLDEIGDLPMDMQANLLRFLQEKTIERIGSIEAIHVDVRVIAATHVDLEKAVREGRFREDLYYRLNVMRIHTPALRDRQGDIELLARYFFESFTREHPSGVKGFSQEALHLMNIYHWPGNVREMINCIRRAIVMSEGRLITPVDLGLERRQLPRKQKTLDQVREEAEKMAIQVAMRRSRNAVSKAAEELDISRMTLYRLLEKYRISV